MNKRTVITGSGRGPVQCEIIDKALKHGQSPLAELARVEKAHDVRTLRPCCVCGCLGNKDTMIDLDDEWFHGRCFVEMHGGAALKALPRSKQDRLTLGDLGFRLMKALEIIKTRRAA